MAHMSARLVTTNDLPSEGVVEVKSNTFESFAIVLTFRIECNERKASVVALSAFETATCAFSEELSFLIRGMTPSKGNPTTDSMSYALFALSSINATINATRAPPAREPNTPNTMLSGIFGLTGRIAGEALSIIFAPSFMRLTCARRTFIEAMSPACMLSATCFSRSMDL